MDHPVPDRLTIPTGPGALHEATTGQLGAWIEGCFGGRITDWHQISGGNRCRSWLVRLDGASVGQVYLRYQPPRAPSVEPYTVWREAQVYLAIAGTGVPAPRLLAVHPEHQAIVTTVAAGRADFRRLTDPQEKTAIIADFLRGLARLHAAPLATLPTGTLGCPATIADCVRAEIAIWRDMYRETGQTDPLIALALDWLDRNVPPADDPPVLVHGDAGPGNFLFHDHRMSALVDWELAHPGDPIEDLAWFSMRAVMEPVPDFAASLADYEAVSGRRIDLRRLLYHRVMVSTRVVIIRHRNVTGLPGNSIVSRALNRRLLVDALAVAEGLALPAHQPVTGAPTARSALYDGLLDDLRIIADQPDPALRTIATNAAKVMKFLREYDRIGAATETRARDLVNAALGSDAPDADTALHLLTRAIDTRVLDLPRALHLLAALIADDAQLAAPSSGGMAGRGFPPIPERLQTR